MNRFVVTMNLGRVAIHPKSRASLQAAAARWDADYIELMEPWGLADPGDVMGAKLELDIVPGVEPMDRVCYIDGDCLVSSRCPDPFAIVMPNQLGVVTNYQGDTHRDPYQAHEPWWNKCAKWFGRPELKYHPDWYFNGGVLIYSPAHHRDVWEVARAKTNSPKHGTKTNPMLEQTAINMAAMVQRIPMCWLPHTFNRLGPAVWNQRGPITEYIIHLANIGDHRGLDNKHRVIRDCEWDVEAISEGTAA